MPGQTFARQLRGYPPLKKGGQGGFKKTTDHSFTIATLPSALITKRQERLKQTTHHNRPSMISKMLSSTARISSNTCRLSKRTTCNPTDSR